MMFIIDVLQTLIFLHLVVRAIYAAISFGRGSAR